MQAILVCAYDKKELRIFLCSVSIEEIFDKEEYDYSSAGIYRLVQNNMLKIKHKPICPSEGYFDNFIDMLETMEKYGITLKEEYHFNLVN